MIFVRRRARQWLPWALVLIGSVTVLSVFLFGPRIVDTVAGPGMEPTIRAQRPITVVAVGPDEIGRGHVVVFYPGSWVGRENLSTESLMVSRVIGLGGDVVMCCDNGQIVVNGKVVREEYLLANDPNPEKAKQPFSVRVPAGHVFLAGDNRGDAVDSRMALDLADAGAIPLSDVRGVVTSLGRGESFEPTSAFIAAGLPGVAPGDTTVEQWRDVFLAAGIVVAGLGVVILGYQRKRRRA